MTYISQYQSENPSLESYWRSLILFGKNTATYKFALAESLLECVEQDASRVSLDELAVPFAQHTCEHLKVAKRQATGKQGKFLEACAGFNDGAVTYDELIDTTKNNAFKYVLDKFHIVDGLEVPVTFYEQAGTGAKRELVLTDDTFKLAEQIRLDTLNQEVDARWSLVEFAWDNDISTKVLDITYNEDERCFFTNKALQRTNITSVKDALNGYQKGQCFYCYETISLDSHDEDACDVDHFYPFSLQKYFPRINLNGVWNLVLSCKDCNRGEDGKFAHIPSLEYVERLAIRNEFLIASHHPLRETLIRQTGATQQERLKFLRNVDARAHELKAHRWWTPPRKKASF